MANHQRLIGIWGWVEVFRMVRTPGFQIEKSGNYWSLLMLLKCLWIFYWNNVKFLQIFCSYRTGFDNLSHLDSTTVDEENEPDGMQNAKLVFDKSLFHETTTWTRNTINYHLGVFQIGHISANASHFTDVSTPSLRKELIFPCNLQRWGCVTSSGWPKCLQYFALLSGKITIAQQVLVGVVVNLFKYYGENEERLSGKLRCCYALLVLKAILNLKIQDNNWRKPVSQSGELR